MQIDNICLSNMKKTILLESVVLYVDDGIIEKGRGRGDGRGRKKESVSR